MVGYPQDIRPVIPPASDIWWSSVETCSHMLQYFEFKFVCYRSRTVNSNTVNSKFHLIRSYCEICFYNFPNIPCLKYTVNSNFHLIRSKTIADEWLRINRSRPVILKPALMISLPLHCKVNLRYLPFRFGEMMRMHSNPKDGWIKMELYATFQSLYHSV